MKVNIAIIIFLFFCAIVCCRRTAVPAPIAENKLLPDPLSLLAQSTKFGKNFQGDLKEWLEAPVLLDAGEYSPNEIFNYLAINQDLLATIQNKNGKDKSVIVLDKKKYPRVEILKMIVDQIGGRYFLDEKARIIYSD